MRVKGHLSPIPRDLLYYLPGRSICSCEAAATFALHVHVCVCLCLCVCVCAKGCIPDMLKLRGSTALQHLTPAIYHPSHKGRFILNVNPRMLLPSATTVQNWGIHNSAEVRPFM